MLFAVGVAPFAHVDTVSDLRQPRNAVVISSVRNWRLSFGAWSRMLCLNRHPSCTVSQLMVNFSAIEEVILALLSRGMPLQLGISPQL